MQATDEISASILAKLEAAGAAGLPKSKLPGSKKAKEALQQLLQSGEINNLGAKTKPLYVSRHFKPFEEAYVAVEAKATPGIVTIYSLKQLKGKCAGAVAIKMGEAIKWLLGEKKLIRIPQGKKPPAYLHSASIRPLVDFGSPLSPSEAELSVESIRTAYDELVRETGFTDVPIASLQKRTGVPLAELKPWLVAQSQARTLVPTRADWSLATMEERAAAIDIAGEPHLRVQML